MRNGIKTVGIILLVSMFFSACGQTIPEETVNGEGGRTEGSGSGMCYEEISLEDAKKLMEQEEDYVILDVRTQEEYAQGHIPGAVCVPNETIAGEMPEELPEKDRLILVYCRSGNRSKQASQKLAELGYTNVKEFGGIISWDGEIEQ